MQARFTAGFCACLAMLSGSAVAQAPPAASAFAALPEMSLVRLSPDGQRVAWANDPGGSPVVVVVDLTTGKDLKRLRPSNARIRDLDWADNRMLVMSVSRSLTQGASTVAEQRYEFERFLAVDVESPGGEAKSLLMEHPERESVTGAYIERLHPEKPGTIVMSTWDFSQTARREEIGSRLAGGRKDSGYQLSLFEVDLKSGKGRMIESGSPYTSGWVVDRAGQGVARSDWNPETRLYTIFVKQGGSWKSIYSSEIDYDFNLLGLTGDGRSLLAGSSRGSDRFKIWSIPVTGGDIALYFENPDYDVESIVPDRFNGSPAGFSIGGPTPSIHWVDPKMNSMQAAVSKAFPGLETSILDRSEDYQRVVVRTESAANAPVYYLVDFAKGAADIIGEAYPSLADAPMGILEATSYKARDSFDIPAYLTLPPGREPKNLPLVVFPHGGPYSRDETGFDWWNQFLATRGYVVLQPQFRGSVGFGANWYRAGHRQWGRGMQDDISDGVGHLVENGIVDPQRVCIVGASYGGYAALAGAAFTPDLYACAVSVNGVADLPSMLGFIRKQGGADSNALRAWKDLIGNPTDDELARFSPARSIDTIRAPILLIHGANDTVVPFSQSDNFARVLREHGKDYELIRLEDEDHWLSAGGSRLATLQAMEAFLATHLKP